MCVCVCMCVHISINTHTHINTCRYSAHNICNAFFSCITIVVLSLKEK